MRFYNDDPLETPVEWYFVPDKRDTIPWPHVFGSRIYERKEEPQLPLGELYSPVPWQGGKAPPHAPPGGLCGTQSQWQDGCSISDPLPPLWPNSPVPKCCNKPPEVAAGGVHIGARGIEIPCCPGVTLPIVATLRVTVYFLFCPPLDSAPIPLIHDGVPVPALGLTPDWLSGPIMFEPLFNLSYRFCVWCDHAFNTWHYAIVSEDLATQISAPNFFNVASCSPFRLVAEHNLLPLLANCDIIDGDFEVT